METSYRESNRWLHTWSGLVVGWLLFVIFVTGTLSYYVNELNLWMKPEFHKSQVSEQIVNIAVSKTIEELKTSDKISVYLPDDRSNLLRFRMNKIPKDLVVDMDEKIKVPYTNYYPTTRELLEAKIIEDKRKGKKYAPSTYYDATTGELIEQVTKTAGGSFLYKFHFNLYNMPREIARWLVGIATMSMLIAIISGVIIHKRIFKDFFTFRSKNNPRGWMDAHILPSIVTLPYLFMITYSGLLLFINMMMPWARQAYYADDYKSYRKEMNIINETRERSAKETVIEIMKDNKEQDTIVNNLTISEEKLLTIVTKAKQVLNEDIGVFTVEKIKKENNLQVTVNAREGNSIFRGQNKSVVFNTDTGILIKKEPALVESKILQTNSAFRALHEAVFAGPTIRFLFFLSGLIATIAIGTGLILWIEKRKKKSSINKSFGFWLVEKLNIGTITGIFIAMGVYFIANRVIVIDEEARRTMEINIFFIAWLFTYIHAALTQTQKAWTEQLLFGAIIYMILPIINAITVFDDFTQIFNRDSIFIYIDIYFIFTALSFLFIRHILIRKAKKGEAQ